MISRQLNIYDYNNDYEKIYDELKIYGIDEYYRQNFKGKSSTFNTIFESLQNLPNYKKYYGRLKEIIFDYFKNNESIKISYYPNSLIRIEDNRKNGVFNWRSYPVYCLEMIDETIFNENE